MIRSLFPAIFFCYCFLFSLKSQAQTIPQKLASAFQVLLDDPQMRNGIAALHVVDAQTGQVLFDHNGKVGLVPASTQKLITSISTYEILGKDFRYTTRFAYHKNGDKGILLIQPSGDPTLGSTRWPSTGEEGVLARLAQAARSAGISTISEVRVNAQGWNAETIPDGWLWQDIGNYFGAGAHKLNWRENQFDVFLRSGSKIGDPVTVVNTVPTLKNYTLHPELKSAAAGSGDQAYIYFPVNGTVGTIRGTIPINQKAFKISGSLPSPPDQLVASLREVFAKAGITVLSTTVLPASPALPDQGYKQFHTVTSPPLDSLMYWFNRKSVNLYGEALVKTIGFHEEGVGSTDKGVEVIRQYWKARGVPESELNIVDGSGLSPLNRVTAQAQVKLLQHARKQSWFPGFYASLPELNGMKMKSGTIRDVKGFSGYHTSSAGKQYTFSLVVNNYHGSSRTMVQKMYNVLNALK